MEVADGTTVEKLLMDMGLGAEDVEAVFINGSIQPVDALVYHGDRVAVMPPGTPGPYRVLLGMMREKKSQS